MKPKTYLDIYPTPKQLKRSQCVLEAAVKYFEDINICGSYMDVIEELKDQIDLIKLEREAVAFYAYMSR